MPLWIAIDTCTLRARIACVIDWIAHWNVTCTTQKQNCKIRILFLNLKEKHLWVLLTVIANAIGWNNNYIEDDYHVVNLACVDEF